MPKAWSKWVGIGAAVGIISALVPVVSGTVTFENPLGKIRKGQDSSALPNLDGLDLTRLKLHPRRVTTPLSEGRTAELTLDPHYKERLWRK